MLFGHSKKPHLRPSFLSVGQRVWLFAFREIVATASHVRRGQRLYGTRRGDGGLILAPASPLSSLRGAIFVPPKGRQRTAKMSALLSAVPGPDEAGLSAQGLRRLWAEVEADPDVRRARRDWDRARSRIRALLAQKI